MHAPSSMARLLRANPSLRPAGLRAAGQATQPTTTIPDAIAGAALPVLLLGVGGLALGGYWAYSFVRSTWGGA